MRKTTFKIDQYKLKTWTPINNDLTKFILNKDTVGIDGWTMHKNSFDFGRTIRTHSVDNKIINLCEVILTPNNKNDLKKVYWIEVNEQENLVNWILIKSNL